ncbi:MAG: hypothetical protein V4812_18090 [Pseudomonadota bacterium]
MIVELILDIDGPFDSVNQQVEVFTTLTRRIEISIAPFIGLLVQIPSNILHSDPRTEQYGELFRLVSDPAVIFHIEQVIVSVSTESKHESIQVISTPAFEPTTAQFHAYVKFLTIFYGFA